MDYRYIDWKSLQVETNPFIFKSIDGHPILFYFHIHNSEIKGELETLVLKCGGRPVEHFFDITPLTVLMVDDNSVGNFYKRVSFKVSYVIDCIRTKCLLDINEYIHNSVSKIENKDYMEIIFSRQGNFSIENFNLETIENINCSSGDGDDLFSLSGDFEIKNLDNRIECKKSIELDVIQRPYILNIPTFRSKSTEKEERNTSHENYSVNVQTEFQEEDSYEKTSFNYKQLNPEKHTRLFYSREEKEAILNYIVKKDCIYSVRGVVVWRKMERSNICPKRTWMSMQNHFKRTLIHELENFPFLTADQIRELKESANPVPFQYVSND